MFDGIDLERMDYYCNKILQNEKILESNGTLWRESLDIQLKEFVILYNFNFYEVANKFQYFMSEGKKYQFTEDEIRRHWAFIHAARYLNVNVDEGYYDVMRTKYRVEEIKKRKPDLEKERQIVEEEERIKKEIEKMRYDRFNLISINPDDENKSNVKKLENEEGIKQVNENYGNLEDLEIVEENFKNSQKLKNVENENTENTLKQIKNENNINDDNSNENNEEDDEVINNLFKNTKNAKNINLNQNDLTEINNNNNYNKEDEDNYDNNLFPINTHQNFYNNNEDKDNLPQDDHNSSFQGIDRDIEKTKNIEDYINEDKNLKEQYDNLNTYYNFTVKSLNYFIPKLNGKEEQEENNINNEITQNNENNLNNENIQTQTDQFEERIIKKTSEKINELFYNSMKEASLKLAEMGREEFEKKLDEEELKMDDDLLNKKQILNNIDQPNENDQEEKLTKFRSYLFTEATKITTPDLLSKIVDIINNTYIDEVKVRNDDDEEEINTPDATEINKTTNITQSSEENKMYKYYYRGQEYYTDKPPKVNDNSDDSFVDDD